MAKGKWYRANAWGLYSQADPSSKTIARFQPETLVMYLEHQDYDLQPVGIDPVPVIYKRQFVKVGFQDMFGWICFIGGLQLHIDSNGVCPRCWLDLVEDTPL